MVAVRVGADRAGSRPRAVAGLGRACARAPRAHPRSWMPVSTSTIPSPVLERPGVHVRHAGPRQRQAEPPDARQDPVGAADPRFRDAAHDRLRYMRARRGYSTWRIDGRTGSRSGVDAGARPPNPGPMTLSGTNTYLVGAPAWVSIPGPPDPRARRACARRRRRRARRRRRHRAHPPPPRPRRGGRRSLAERSACRRLAGRRGGPTASALRGAGRRGPARSSASSRDGDALGPFVVIETPGHSADHISFLAGRVLFCGDTVLGEGSVFIPPGGGSLGATCESLRRLRDARARALCPGHGPVVWDPRAKLTEYIEHRLDRERRLVAALERGMRAPRRAARRGLGRRCPAVLRPGRGADARGASRQARARGPAARGRRARCRAEPR